MAAIYNAKRIATMSTELLERKLTEAQADLKAKGRGSAREAYYRQMAREQAAKSVTLWTTALRDRRAGLV